MEQQTEQLQQQTHTGKRRIRWWRGIACGLGLLALVSLAPLSQAAEFTCTAGDVACLIDAINQANSTGEADTITLAAGTYTLTAVDNFTDGSNGLPSVTSTLTIRGAGARATSIQGARSFRLVHIAAAGNLTLDKLTLQGGGGKGLEGGGIFNRGTATLQHSIVAHNGSSIASGAFDPGGIANYGMMTLQHSTVADNSTDIGTAGIENNVGGTLLITNSAVVDNLAHGIGGITNAGFLFLTNSTVASNMTIGPNALVSGILNSGTALLTNATITGNQGSASDTRTGGIFSTSDGQTVLVNTILANNDSGNTGRPIVGSVVGTRDCLGPVTSLGTNLIGDPTGCTITLQPSDLTGDPGLGPFTDNGRLGNGHFPLLKTSQAIDAGNNAVCPRTDQLGRLRFGPCDTGAIEFRHRDNRPHDEDDDHHDRDRADATRASQ